MVNGPDDVYVERGGIERAPDGLFEGEEAVLHLIERIAGPMGPSRRRIIDLGGCATGLTLSWARRKERMSGKHR